MPNAVYSQFLAFAHEIADAAAAISLPLFRQPTMIDNKQTSGFDPVTQADRDSELAMRQMIEDKFPSHAILGEEWGAKAGDNFQWVLDPIDGTRGFLSGTPTWGVLVALCNANGPLFGVIDQPYIGERFLGGFGQARLEGLHGTRALATRRARPLSSAIIFTTFPEVGTQEEGAAFHRLAQQCQLTRYGMDCYAYALLALGQIDLVVEAGLQPYDILAPIAVIEAAGGIVTDWQGGPATKGGRVLAAANTEIHAQALAILSQH